jgi:ketosteroid isomerase-like protein
MTAPVTLHGPMSFTASATAGPSAESPELRVVRAFLDAISAGRDTDAMALVDPSAAATWRGRNPISGTHHGPAQIVQRYATLRTLSLGTYRIAEELFWLTMGPHIHHVSIDEATRDGVTARFPRTTTFEVKESRIVELTTYEEDQYAFDAFWAPTIHPHIARVRGYLAAVELGDFDGAAAAFTNDCTYVVPGTSVLAGTTTGPRAALEYFRALQQIVAGSYRVVDMVDWLHSADRVALIANEALTTQDTVFEWTRVVLFTFASTGQISRVQLFDDRQHELDVALARGNRSEDVSEVI